MGEAVDVRDIVETSEGKSREEKVEMYMDTFKSKELFDTDDDEEDENGCHSMTFKEFASLRLDIIESEGFDIGDYSKAFGEGQMIRFYDPPTRPTKYLSRLIDLSCLAIEEYNKREGTNYGNVHVLKANAEPCMGVKYYITFQAFDKFLETFQARVYVGIPTSHRMVELVRIKIPLKPILIIKPRGADRSIVCREGERFNLVSTPTVSTPTV